MQQELSGGGADVVDNSNLDNEGGLRQEGKELAGQGSEAEAEGSEYTDNDEEKELADQGSEAEAEGSEYTDNATYMGMPSSINKNDVKLNENLFDYGIDKGNGKAPNDMSDVYQRSLLMFCKENGLLTTKDANSSGLSPTQLAERIKNYKEKTKLNVKPLRVSFGSIHAVAMEEHWKQRGAEYESLKDIYNHARSSEAKKDAAYKALREGIASDGGLLDNHSLYDQLCGKLNELHRTENEEGYDRNSAIVELFNIAVESIYKKAYPSKGIRQVSLRTQEIREGIKGLQLASELEKQISYQKKHAGTDDNIVDENLKVARSIFYDSKKNDKEIQQAIIPEGREQFEENGIKSQNVSNALNTSRRLIKSKRSRRKAIFAGGLILGIAAIGLAAAAIATDTGHELVTETLSSSLVHGGTLSASLTPSSYQEMKLPTLEGFSSSKVTDWNAIAGREKPKLDLVNGLANGNISTLQANPLGLETLKSSGDSTPDATGGFTLLKTDPTITNLNSGLTSFNGNGGFEGTGTTIDYPSSLDFKVVDVDPTDGVKNINLDQEFKDLQGFSGKDQVNLADVLESQNDLKAALTPENIQILKARQMYGLLKDSIENEQTTLTPEQFTARKAANLKLLNDMSPETLAGLAKSADNKIGLSSTDASSAITINSSQFDAIQTIDTSKITTLSGLDQATGAELDHRNSQITELQGNIRRITPVSLSTSPTPEELLNAKNIVAANQLLHKLVLPSPDAPFSEISRTEWNNIATVQQQNLNFVKGIDPKNLTNITDPKAIESIKISAGAGIRHDVFYTDLSENIPAELKLSGSNERYLAYYDQALSDPDFFTKNKGNLLSDEQSFTDLQKKILNGLQDSDIEKINLRKKLELIEIYNSEQTDPTKRVSENISRINETFSALQTSTKDSHSIAIDQIQGYQNVVKGTSVVDLINSSSVNDSRMISNFTLLDTDPTIVNLRDKLNLLEGNGFANARDATVHDFSIKFDQLSIYPGTFQFKTGNPDMQFQLVQYYAEQNQVDVVSLNNAQKALATSLNNPDNIKIFKARQVYTLLKDSGVSQDKLNTMSPEDMLMLQQSNGVVSIGGQNFPLKGGATALDNIRSDAKANELLGNISKLTDLDQSKVGGNPLWLEHRKAELADLNKLMKRVTPVTLGNPPTETELARAKYLTDINQFRNSQNTAMYNNLINYVTPSYDSGLHDSTVRDYTVSDTRTPIGSRKEYVNYTQSPDTPLTYTETTMLSEERFKQHGQMSTKEINRLQQAADNPAVVGVTMAGGIAIAGLGGAGLVREIYQDKQGGKVQLSTPEASEILKKEDEEKRAEAAEKIKNNQVAPTPAAPDRLVTERNYRELASRMVLPPRTQRTNNEFIPLHQGGVVQENQEHTTWEQQPDSELQRDHFAPQGTTAPLSPRTQRPTNEFSALHQGGVGQENQGQRTWGQQLNSGLQRDHFAPQGTTAPLSHRAIPSLHTSPREFSQISYTGRLESEKDPQLAPQHRVRVVNNMQSQRGGRGGVF